MMEDDQQFCLRWNNHQNTLISNFDKLLENGTLVDCTLAAEGQFLKAHKVVLSACSPYFANLLKEQYDKHPIFILKDVKYQELRAMMDYMYRGEVNISQDQLAALLKAAESLQIKGLSDRPQRSTDQHQNINVPGRMQHPHSGYTLEQASKRPRLGPVIDTPDMREGSSSPTSRKRKKLRRRSIENVMDNHEHSNSSAHSTQPINTSTPSITSGTAAIVATSQQQQQQSQQSLQQSSVSQQQQQQGNIVGTKKTENVSNIKQTAGSSDDVLLAEQDNQMEQDKLIKKDQNKQQRKSGHDKEELLIEPKNEYEDVNEPVEDLTEDPEELLDDEDLDNQAGPSHHGGEGSSQGFPQWPADRSQDEFIMTAQDQGQQRDPQELNNGFSLLQQLSKSFTGGRQTSNKQKQQQRQNPSFHEDPQQTLKSIGSVVVPNTTKTSLSLYNAVLDRYVCPNCEVVYTRESDALHHFKKECGREIRCPYCWKLFRRKNSIKDHVRNKHRNLFEDYKTAIRLRLDPWFKNANQLYTAMEKYNNSSNNSNNGGSGDVVGGGGVSVVTDLRTILYNLPSRTELGLDYVTTGGYTSPTIVSITGHNNCNNNISTSTSIRGGVTSSPTSSIASIIYEPEITIRKLYKCCSSNNISNSCNLEQCHGCCETSSTPNTTHLALPSIVTSTNNNLHNENDTGNNTTNHQMSVAAAAAATSLQQLQNFLGVTNHAAAAAAAAAALMMMPQQNLNTTASTGTTNAVVQQQQTQQRTSSSSQATTTTTSSSSSSELILKKCTALIPAGGIKRKDSLNSSLSGTISINPLSSTSSITGQLNNSLNVVAVPGASGCSGGGGSSGSKKNAIQFDCNFCSFSCTWKYDLKLHLRQKHGIHNKKI